MQTISAQPTRSNVPLVSAAAWPECVEESFERLVASMELIAGLPLTDVDILRVATHAM